MFRFLKITFFQYVTEMLLTLLPSDPLSNIVKTQFMKWHGAVLGKSIKFGRGLWIDHFDKITIGNNVFFNYGCQLNSAGGIQIDDNVLIGPGVTILSANHDIKRDQLMRFGRAILKQVHVEKNVWLGARCILTPGVIIGEGSVVAAGAVVTKNVPAYKVVGGVPAKIIKDRV
jgi:acetyltransferase-like isoleucine patch superfamily enzyme